jgi:predicted membrane channel-forming protein YqfA (hemolysin III family)
MKKIVKIAVGSLWALPFMALAQTVNPTYVSSLIDSAKGLLDQIVVFLIALAVVWFIWNVISYTMSSDEDKKKAAKSQMIWGVVAIAVIVSVWGLVAILQNIFGVNTTGAGNVSRLLP